MLVVFPDPLDLADLQDFQDFQVPKDIVDSPDVLERTEKLVLLERRVTLDPLVPQVLLAHKVFVVPQESVDVMEVLDPLVSVVMMDNPALPDLLDQLDPLDLLASQESLELREMLALLVPVVLKVLLVDVVRMDFQDPQVLVETQVFPEKLVPLVLKVIADQSDLLVAQDSLEPKDLADKAETLEQQERKVILDLLVFLAKAEIWDLVVHLVLPENVVFPDLLDPKERGDLPELLEHPDPKETLVKLVLLV